MAALARFLLLSRLTGLMASAAGLLKSETALAGAALRACCCYPSAAARAAVACAQPVVEITPRTSTA